MPTVSPIATTTTTRTVVLRPTVKRRLLVALQSYNALRLQVEALKAQMEDHKGTIQALREETGEATLAIDGFKVVHVSPVRPTLDHKKLIELGCAAAWITEATTMKPTKDYERIYCPGEKE